MTNESLASIPMSETLPRAGRLQRVADYVKGLKISSLIEGVERKLAPENFRDDDINRIYGNGV